MRCAPSTSRLLRVLLVTLAAGAWPMSAAGPRASALGDEDTVSAQSVPGSPCAVPARAFEYPAPFEVADNGVPYSAILNVSGVGTWLWDVDVHTSIAHESSSDLVITLTSPKGTAVTLSDRNGKDANGQPVENAFNGTTWDDQAGTAVTDYTFTTGGAGKLAPQEPLASLLGEDPNGKWMLTVRDVEDGGAPGIVGPWSITVTAFPSAPQTRGYTQLQLAGPNNQIPNAPFDFFNQGLVKTTSVGVGGWLVRVGLGMSLSHSYSADLDIVLESPAGTSVTITTDNGGAFDDVFWRTNWYDQGGGGAGDPVTLHAFSDGATPALKPEEPLAAFQGEDPTGTWTLRIKDDSSHLTLVGETPPNTGTLSDWSLWLTYGTCNFLTPTLETQAPAPAVTNLPLNEGVTGMGIGVVKAGTADGWRFDATAGATIWAMVDTGGQQHTDATSRNSSLLLSGPDMGVLETDEDDGTGNGADDTVETLDASLIAGYPVTETGAYLLSVHEGPALGPASQKVIDPYRLYTVVTKATVSDWGDVPFSRTPLVSQGRALKRVRGLLTDASPIGTFTVEDVPEGAVLFVAADGDVAKAGGNSVDLELTLDDSSTFNSPILTVNSSASGPRSAEGFVFRIPETGTYHLRVRRLGGAVVPFELLGALLLSPTSDLRMTVERPATPVAGALLTTIFTARNDGPGSAINSAVSLDIPAGQSLWSLSKPDGWDCTPLQQGATSEFSCRAAGDVPSGGSAVFTLVTRVDADRAGQEVLSRGSYSFWKNADEYTWDIDSTNNSASLSQVAAAPTPGDADNDGIPDEVEERYGLDPGDGVGDNGHGGDPDHDGVTTDDEIEAGTHPKGIVKRYFAEGATGDFFDTRIAIFNPSATETAHVQARYYTAPTTPPVVRDFLVAPHGRTTIDVEAVDPSLASTAVSTSLESDIVIAADRLMRWDATGYGAHGEAGAPGPSTTWYLAEGSTAAEFTLFYLIQNPSDSDATLTVKYLRPSPLPPITKNYEVKANSRFNIWVDIEGPDLASTDVSATITSTVPVIVERAMYLDVAGQTFTAGHASTGVTQPALTWFLAEGATGDFFDLFVLIANPADADAAVTADYLLPSGVTITKTYTVPANSRFNIWVDLEGTDLANTPVSTRITSTNGVPVIVERSMWWPGAYETWTEAHNSPGATTTGTVWAVAAGETGGPYGDETYLLLANTSNVDGEARVTLFLEDGSTHVRTYPLKANSRTNVAVPVDFELAGATRFGALVESHGTPPPALVVEEALYRTVGGETWASGTVNLATKIQ